MVEPAETGADEHLEALRCELRDTTWFLPRSGQSLNIKVEWGARPLEKAPRVLRRVNLGAFFIGVHAVKACHDANVVWQRLEAYFRGVNGEARGWELAGHVFGEDVEFRLRLLAFGQVAGFWPPEYRDLTAELNSDGESDAS